MNEKEAYKYCPKCGGDLTEHSKYKDHLKCKKCDFDFFLNAKPCVSAIITKENEILLTKRSFNPHKGSWEIPGGFVDKDETLEEAFIRELQEEFDCKPNNIQYMFSFPAKYRLKDNEYDIIISYFACDHPKKIKLNKENSEYGFFNLNSIPKGFHPGHIEAIEKLKNSLN